VRVLFLLTFISVAAYSATWTEIQKTKTLRLATEGVFPPFNYYKGSELTGFEVELGNVIARHLDTKPQWKVQLFESLLIGVNENHYDLVVASFAITPERSKAVEFSNPHYCGGAVIITKPGGPQKAKDLAGKVVATQVGTTYFNFLKKLPSIKEVRTFSKEPDSLLALIQGRIDAVVTERFAAEKQVIARAHDKLILGETIYRERLAMAVAKGNLELRDRLNGALQTVLSNGTYQQISEKYFGQDIRCRN